MSSEGGLKRMDATHQGDEPESVIPEGPPGRSEDAEACVELLEQLKEMHNKYKKIVDKIKSGYNQLFLIKCGTSKGNYHFLAKYKSDTYNQYFQDEQSVFSTGIISDPCSKEQLKNFKTLEKMKEHYNKIPPLLFYNFEHKTYGVGSTPEQINLAPKYFQYDDFKNSIIPIEEAFMYKEIRKEPLKIVGYNSEIQKEPELPPAVPALPPGMDEADVVDLTGDEEKQFKDVNENDGTEIEDIEIKDDERKVGGRKKRRKKRSRSKKRRRGRKNRTKKN